MEGKDASRKDLPENVERKKEKGGKRGKKKEQERKKKKEKERKRKKKRKRELLRLSQLPPRLSLIPRRPSNLCIVEASIVLYRTPSLLSLMISDEIITTKELTGKA